jgi:3-dehydroshikimate dehydratase
VPEAEPNIGGVMLVPGLVSVTFRKLAPAEIVALARECGLQAIEWGGDVHVPLHELARAREVRGLSEEAGIAVSGYGSYYRVGAAETADRRFEHVLETAVELGAPTIRVWAGAAASAQIAEGERAHIVAELRRIADLAARQSVSISLEYHGGTLTDTNESAAQLLREVDHPNVYTFWQPPNGQSLEYCLEGLLRVLPRVTCVHCFHWWPTSAERRPLADGWPRWERYLGALLSTGRRIPVLLEFLPGDEPEALRRDAATLRHWIRLLARDS